ncbi:efflux RND transporter periplasmic adaptor subunit [Schlesneria paludicola]|uniref:efflux RND transporter periplasmic adaptor subunit n=1 Tax=Schlesneria paludicola TaxID=360056 RepID=UPI00029AB313|nr:efflux RND transporter periplasmic adaptor subunit [Schlesneria paludicola]
MTSHTDSIAPWRWLRPVGISIALILVAIIGIGVWVYARDAVARDKAATRVPVVERVSALGRLEPRGTVLNVSVPSGNEGATVQRLLVEESQDVDVGDLIAVLDIADRRQSAVDEAEARWRVAQSKLAQILAGAKPGDINAQEVMVRQMETQVAAMLRELDRAKQLAARKAIPEESLEQKQLAYDRELLQCERARAQLESLREVRNVDVQLQEMEVAVAAASLNRARAELAAAQVRSPIAGRILKIHTRPGERVNDRGILQIGDVAHMQAVAEIFEGDLRSVQVGQNASIHLTSTGERIAGKVEQIGLLVARKDVLSNDPVSDTDARVLEVRITLDAADLPKVERMSNARVEVAIDISAPSNMEPKPSLPANPPKCDQPRIISAAQN